MAVHGHAACAAKERLKPFTYEAGDLGPVDVEIRVDCCGICHSDIHLIDNDWLTSKYPFIPGHEIVGSVTAVGKEVVHLKAGQRVGVGWQAASCMQCEWCVRGDENLCVRPVATCVGRNGGFADAVRVDSRFAFPLPEGLDSAGTAPLLCGGITVYSPLRHFGVRPSSRVGIVGVGGLGHMAIQFARAFGCEVTAFSTSADKEEESRRLGAHRFIVNRDQESMAKAVGTLDFILATPHTDLNWTAYLNILRPKGTLCVVGASPGAMRIPPGALLMQLKSVTGSVTGNRATIREMLEFAARHGIAAITEVMPMREVNTALDRVRAGRARYRVVLKA